MGKKLYVGNLSYETPESELREIFSEIGAVSSVSLVMDRETGRSKGFAFVEMETDEVAQTAQQKLNGRMVGNRSIRVDEARPPGERSFGSSRSSGGSYRPSRTGYNGGGYGGSPYGGGSYSERGGYGGGSRGGKKKKGNRSRRSDY